MDVHVLQPAMIPNKQLIEQRFSKAAATYEQQADVQHTVADTLLAMLDPCLPQDPLTVLEIGCCTGLLTEKLVRRFPGVSKFVASDLCGAFAPYIQQRIGSLQGRARFISGDIESLAIRDRYDLIISSSTFHWIHDLPQLFTKLRSNLSPGGILAFSIYGEQNLEEIRNITHVGLPYKEFPTILDEVRANFSILAADHSRETLWFPSPMAILQHLRQTGVNAIGTKVWTRRELSVFCRQYEANYAGPGGYSLTYHPMYFIAQATPQ